jgi:catechol 2,3-dioxygenase-like lactoylglutathione lyase family enzyme
MTQFLALDHVQLGMPPGSDEAARAFYVGVLGLTEIAPPAPLRGLWFRAGTVELHLHDDEHFRPSAYVHPALRVRGLATIAERCESAGCSLRHDTRYPGRTRFYVKDPFGNEIEILELHSDREAWPIAAERPARDSNSSAPA